MKKLLFTTVFFATTLFQSNIHPADSTPLPATRLAQLDPSEGLLTPQQVRQTAKNITVRISAANNGGSGVIIAQKGDNYLILTNAHVIRRAAQLEIQAPDGQKYNAKPIDGGFSAKYDLALVQFTSKTKYALAQLMDKQGKPPTPLDPERTIYSAGFPFDSQEIRITQGQVSQLTDIPFDDGTQIGYTIDKGKKGIRQGMSGGAIFDAQGNFLGINTIGIAPILPNYTYNDGSKPIPKLKDLYARANWGIPVYNFLTNVKAEILYGYDNLPKVVHQSTPTGYMAGLNDKARKMTVRIENSDGSGSGVIVARQGNSYYVLTAKHVVQDEKNNTHEKFTNNQIITYDQDAHQVTSTVVAEGVDLAVIKFTSNSSYPVAKLGQYNTKDDDLVFAGGFPGRDKINSPLWQWQLNPGYIFGRERGKLKTQNDTSFTNGYDLIYGSISYGGMSGGPVFDTNSNVIGIHGRGEAADLSSLGISIQTFIGLAKANKLQIAPNLLTIDSNHPSNLKAEDRKNVIAAMQNLAQPQEGDPGQLWLDYGNQLYRTRQYELSVVAFDKAIAKDRQLALSGNYGKATALVNVNKFDLAAIAIGRAIAAVPSEKRADYYYLWSKQSAILRKRYKFDEALKAIDIAIVLNPSDLDLRHEKAATFLAQRRFQEVIAIENDLIRIKPEWYFYSIRGLTRSYIGDNKGAIEDHNTVIKLNPDFEVAYVYRAGVKSRMGDNRGALADMNRALELNPNSDWVYNMKARFRSEIGDDREAMADINRAIQLNPEDDSNYDFRADIKRHLNDYQGAIADRDRAIKINPFRFEYYASRASDKLYGLEDAKGAIVDFDKAIEINPNFDTNYMSRGFARLELGDSKGAMADAEQGIKINPNNPDLYGFRAIVKSRMRDKKGALADYELAIKLAPKHPIRYLVSNALYNKLVANLYIGRGKAKSELCDDRGGIDDINRAIELNAKDFLNYELRATVRSKMDNSQGAIADFSKAIEINPKAANSYGLRAAEKFKIADYQGALRDYSKAIELNHPKKAGIYSSRAYTKLKLGDKQGSINDLSKAIELDPKNALYVYLRGIVKSESGDKQGAIADYTQAIKVKPNYAEAYSSRADIKFQLGDNRGAIDDYNKAIELNPKRAIDYALRGVVKSNSGDKQGGIDDYTQAIKLDPNSSSNYETYTNRGNDKSVLGDKNGAIADYNKAIELNPKYALAYGGRGDVKDRLGDKQGAISDYIQAIKIDPKYYRAYYARGNVKLGLGDRKGAIDDYTQAITIDPKFADAYINRGDVEFELGDNVAAMKDTNRAIELNPNSALAYANRGAFKIIDNKEREALPDLERAIKLDPKMSYAYAGRGVVKETLGDRQGAISDYKQALKLNPQIINEWKKQSESVRKYNAASYQKYQQMIQKLESGSKLG